MIPNFVRMQVARFYVVSVFHGNLCDSKFYLSPVPYAVQFQPRKGIELQSSSMQFYACLELHAVLWREPNKLSFRVLCLLLFNTSKASQMSAIKTQKYLFKGSV